MFCEGSIKPTCCDKWDTKLGVDINWKNVFTKIHQIQDIRLKWFQIRLVHRILATNIVLKEMGVVSNNLCSFCNNERESLQHLFWTCKFSCDFWNELERLINEKCQHASNFKFSQSLILFGQDNKTKTDKILDLIIVLAKMFLYHCRQTNRTPRVCDFFCTFKERYAIEKYNAKVTFDSGDFSAKWAYYKELLEVT
jgi:hypothetical protein